MRRIALIPIILALAALVVGFADTYKPTTYGENDGTYDADGYPGNVMNNTYVRSSVAVAVVGDDPVVTVKTKQDTNHTLRIDCAYIEGSGSGSAVARTIVHGDTASADHDRYSVSVDLDSITGDWSAYDGDTLEVWVLFASGLVLNEKHAFADIPDTTNPTIADTSSFLIAIDENGGAGTFTVSATADEDAIWTMQAIVGSNYPDWGDTATAHWQWKSRAQGVHAEVSKGYNDSLIAHEVAIDDGLYRLDDLVVRLKATDQFGNDSDWYTLYDGTMESLIDVGAGSVPAGDEYQFSVYLQDGQLVPDDASIAEWSEVPLMLCQTDHILGTEAAANAGYEHWIADARAESGAKELVVVAHGGEHCQFNTTSPFAKRKWYWAEFAYDSLMTADDTTNAFIHRYDGELAHYRNSSTFYRGPIVNFADEDGRRLFARFTAQELAYADNLVDYIGLFYDVWDPSRGYAIYDTDSTSALNATLGYDCDRDGTPVGTDADEQELRWNGFNAWFNVLREELAYAGLDTDKVILGANSDVMVSHEAHLGNVDFLYVEDYGCPSVSTTPWRSAPYHHSVDANYYQPSAIDGYDLLYGSDYPDPETYIATWFDFTTDMRTDIGPFVVTERRSSYYWAEHPVQLEVWGLMFDDVYPEWTDWTTGSQYRSYNTPHDSGFDDLSQLGAASGAASVDSTTYSGFVEITRSFASGEARIMIPERVVWDCETDSLEYLVYLTGSDTLRQSTGFDITPPSITSYSIAAWDSGGAETTLRASVSVELGESSLLRARSATSSGGLTSADWETLSTEWTSQSDWHNTGINPYTGTLYVQISALDGWGNEATDTDNVAVSRPVPADETPPTIDDFVYSDVDTSGSDILFNYDLDILDVGDVGGQLAFGWSLFGDDGNPPSYNYSAANTLSITSTSDTYTLTSTKKVATIGSVLPDTIRTRVTVSDSLGNWSAPSYLRTYVERAVPDDETAPTITPSDSTFLVATDQAYAAAVADEAWYQWFQTREGVGGAWAELDSSWSDTTIASGDTAKFYYDASGTSDGDTIWFAVGGRDAAYNVSTPEYFTVIAPDRTAPDTSSYTPAVFDTTDTDDVQLDLALEADENSLASWQWRSAYDGTWTPTADEWVATDDHSDTTFATSLSDTINTTFATSELDSAWVRFRLKDDDQNVSSWFGPFAYDFTRDDPGDITAPDTTSYTVVAFDTTDTDDVLLDLAAVADEAALAWWQWRETYDGTWQPATAEWYATDNHADTTFATNLSDTLATGQSTADLDSAWVRFKLKDDDQNISDWFSPDYAVAFERRVPSPPEFSYFADVVFDTTDVVADTVSAIVEATVNENAKAWYQWRAAYDDPWLYWNEAYSTETPSTSPSDTLNTHLATSALDSFYLRARFVDSVGDTSAWTASLDTMFTRDEPAGGGDPYDVTSAYVYVQSNTSASNMKVCIYTVDPNTLIATSDATAIGTTPGYTECSFSSPPSLTAGVDYHIGVILDGSANIGQTGAAWSGCWTTGGSYSSPPTSVAWDSGNAALLTPCVYAVNSDDDTLIGNDAVPSGDRTLSADALLLKDADGDGYTCVTLP